MRIIPTHIAENPGEFLSFLGYWDFLHVKTAPLCSVLKLWFVLKTNGTELNWRYRTAQLKAAQREKKKTTGSVNSMSKEQSGIMRLEKSKNGM